MSRSLPRPDPALGLVARIDVALSRIDRRRLAAMCLAAAIAVVTIAAVQRSRSVVAALGSTTAVAVAARPLEPGQRLGPDDIEWQQWPTGLAPVGVDPDRTIGATVRWPLAVDDPILASALTVDGTIEADERAVTVPLPLAPPPVRPGDLVELLGLRPGFALGDQPTLDTLDLGSGRIIAIDDTGITVVVERGSEIAIVETIALGSVEFVLTPSVSVGRPTAD